MEGMGSLGMLEARPLNKVHWFLPQGLASIPRLARTFFFYAPQWEHEIFHMVGEGSESEVIFLWKTGQRSSHGGVDWFYPILITIEELYITSWSYPLSSPANTTHTFWKHPQRDEESYPFEVTINFILPPYRGTEDFLIFFREKTVFLPEYAFACRGPEVWVRGKGIYFENSGVTLWTSAILLFRLSVYWRDCRHHARGNQKCRDGIWTTLREISRKRHCLLSELQKLADYVILLSDQWKIAIQCDFYRRNGNALQATGSGFSLYLQITWINFEQET